VEIFRRAVDNFRMLIRLHHCVACWTILALLHFSLPLTARGDEWSLTTADLQSQPIIPRALTAEGLRVARPDGKTERIIPLDQFVSIQRTITESIPATAAFTLSLSNGDRIVGDPGTVDGEKLIWINPALGKIPVPFNRLMSIVRGSAPTPVDEPPKQDVVTLTNGDSVAGVFSGCADRKLTMQTDGGPAVVPLDSVKRILFAPTGARGAADSAHGYRIRLNDGSILTVAQATLDADQLKLTLKGKNPVSTVVPMTSVLAIEQSNGPVSWLSSHVPTEQIQIPYLSGSQSWPARFDLAVDGSPLTFDNRTYEHGIGVHAYSKLTFAIDPQWTVFRTQFAIDSKRDMPRKYAEVTVRILLDEKLVHEVKHVREGEISKPILLELHGAKTLTLECDYGDAGDTQAHLDWLQPALLRELPPPPAAPATMPSPTTAPTVTTSPSTMPSPKAVPVTQPAP
jgi:hypothetical protein